MKGANGNGHPHAHVTINDQLESLRHDLADQNLLDRHGRYDKHDHHPHHRRVYPMPDHVYDRYTDAMEGVSGHERSPRPHKGQGQYPDDTPVDVDQVTTLYIPKVKIDDGTKTLMRRRRTSSKRRSSSRREHERQNMDDLLSEEDNHLLPSLRLARRHRLKSLKDRRVDLEEEKRFEQQGYSPDGMEHKSFKERYHDLKERENLTAGNFANLLRDTTLTRVRRLGDWKQPRKWEVFRKRSREYLQHFKLWVTSLKIIEGKFGTAVMSYFRFVRWLMFLNLYIMIIMFCVITVPYLAINPTSFPQSLNQSASVFHSQAINCTENYELYRDQLHDKASTFEKVLDFLQGTGWMERTVLFYGVYHNRTHTRGDETYTYDMGLAYFLATGACFFISFLLVIKNSSKTVKATFGMESSVAAFNNRVFAGWDYAITNKKAAEVKHSNIYTEYKDVIAEELWKKKRHNRSANDKATLILTRILVNCVVLGILAGALFLVYYTTDKLLELQKKELNEVVALIVQYLPYLTITILNFILPLVFSKIVILEDYSHINALSVTLARSISLRLASLGVLIGSLYRLLIIEADPDDGFCGNRLWDLTGFSSRGSIKCWESYVGQQIYKLVLLDLVVETSIIVFVQLPRRLLYNKYGTTVGFIKRIGPQEFDLPQCVIDIIYSQTLCWLGLIFCPLIPFMTFVKCIIFFYLRKWTLLKNCHPADEQFRTSRSHSLFMFVLLFSFLLATVPMGYMVSSIAPSQSCGPFRVYSSSEFHMFDALTNSISTWPIVIKDIVRFLGTVGFLIPIMIVLCLLMYYFWLLGSGYKKREKMLQEQLKLEAKDKQFLLLRVNEVLRLADG